MATVKLYTRLAQLIGAYKRCTEEKNTWRKKHEETIRSLVREHMPHGSGFDSGTTLDLDASSEERIVLHTSFHHMNDVGMYDGWTEHKVTVRPSLAFGFHLTISGPNRNEIKDMMGETFDYTLRLDVDDGRVSYATQAPSPNA